MLSTRRLREYRSRFTNWDRRASVRVKPDRSQGIGAPDALYFSPELVPAASHPLVVARGPEAVRRFLVHRLHQYLYFTVELEQLAVIPVTTDISLGRAGLRLPEGMRADAFKITTDEAWHAQFSYGLIRTVESATGVLSVFPVRQQFLDRVDRVRDRIDPRVRGAHDLLFGVVSETLISSILRDLPRDRRLPEMVRDLVADHAEDEGRHHAYFRTVLDHLWLSLSAGERALLGPHVPELVRAFLDPDLPALAIALFDLGLSDREVQQVLAECHPPEVVRADATLAARATAGYFAEVGALDDPATRDAFGAAGLWGER